MPLRLNHIDRIGGNLAVVIVPGGPGFSSRCLEPLDVVADSFPIVTVDFPGTGGLPEEAPYSFQGLAEDLELELAALPYHRFLAVGYSAGGLTAAALATRGRIDVRGFVGFASPLSLRSLAMSNVHSRSLATATMNAIEAEVKANPSNEGLLRYLNAAAPLYFSPPFIDEGKKLIALEKPSARMFGEIYADLYGGKVPDYLAALRRLSIPKFLVAGEMDGVMPLAALELDAEDGGCQLVRLAGAGHYVNLERPREVAQVLAHCV